MSSAVRRTTSVNRRSRRARSLLSVALLCAVAVIATACPPDTTDPGQQPSEGLPAWKELRPAVVTMGDGRMATFKVNAAGRLSYRVQERPMTGADYYMTVGWLPSQTVSSGPELATSPSVTLNANNTVEVVATGVDGVMYHLTQTALDNAVPLSSFGTWQPLPSLGTGVTLAGAPTVSELDGNSIRDVVVLGSDGNFWTTNQIAGAGTYTPWTKRYGAGLGLTGSAAVAVRPGPWTELWFLASDGTLRGTTFNQVTSQWAGSFGNLGGSWGSSPVLYLSPAGRLAVAGSNSAKELLTQAFIPTAAQTVRSAGANGTPAVTTSGGKTYLFMIRDDGRLQFAPVNDEGAPQDFYVIDQPGVPVLQTPGSGALVYVPAPVTLTAAAVPGADQYWFELWEILPGGGRTQIGGEKLASPTWTVPAATMTAGKTYQWTTRAYSTTTQLLGWYQTFGLVGSNLPAAPVRTAPANGAVVDPYNALNLVASAVHGATRYRFSIANAANPGVEIYGIFVDSSAGYGAPVSAVIPAGTLPVGSRYNWSVVAYAGGTQGILDGACCSTFLASTGAAASSQMARTNSGNGYWELSYAGDVFGFGDAIDSGGPAGILPAGWTTIGIVARPRSNDDYWVLSNSGAIYTYGGAEYYGGANSHMLPGVSAAGMAPTATGNGYWIVGQDGSVFTYGDAQYYGNNLNNFPAGVQAAGITPTPDGRGYWILGTDGAVYSFGSAQYAQGANGHLSTGDVAIEMQSTPTGSGYWIATRTGAVFTFGSGAEYYGGANPSPGHPGLAGAPAIGFSARVDGGGYWFMGENDGAIFTFGSAAYLGGGNVGVIPAEPAAPDNGAKFFPRAPGDVPTLTAAAGSSTSGHALNYHFVVSTDPSTTTEIVAESAWQPGLTFTPKATDLRDGRTYFWRIETYDGNSYISGSIRTFRIIRRFGTSQPSPYETAGPISINLASGNAVTSWASPQVNGAGFSMTYNSLAPAESVEPGLPRGWSASWAGDTSAQRLIAANGTVTIQMVDGSKETFTWANGGVSGNSWRPEDGSDSTLIDVPGSKWIYTSGDGTTHEFDWLGTLTSTTLPTDQRKSSSLVYTWTNTAIGRRMTAAKDPISLQTMTLSYQGDGGSTPCPTAPAGYAAAPAGDLCSITLMDGRSYAFLYTPVSFDLQQIAAVVGSDATATRFGWEVSTGNALFGQHSRLVSRTDSLAVDVIAAGLRADDASTRAEVAYQADGRASRITQPAPSAGAARQSIGITYTATGATVNRDGDAKPNGYSRQVESDSMGRQTIDRDQGGRTTTTGWRVEAPGDEVAWTLDPSGLRTGTVYDDQWKEIGQWGPAPVAWFDASTVANQWGAIPSVANQAATPHTVTNYDEKVDGTAMHGMAQSFYASSDLSGGVKRRRFQEGNGNFENGTAGVDGLPADGWSMRSEALLTVPVAGNYTFRTDADGGIRVYINDIKVVDSWYQADGVLAPSTGQSVSVALTPAVRAKVRVEYRDLGGNATWALWWTPPGQASGWVPAANLQPNYGLATSTVDPDGHIARTGYADPSTGLATSTTQVVGGGKADLVSSSTYETEGTGWRRQLSRQLPAGPGSTVTYDYYGDSAGPVANTCGASVAPIQAGRPKSTTAADPDGAGPQQALKRWFVYDGSGRTVGLLTTTADVGEANLGTQSWVCTTFDVRGRVLTTSYPAFGGAAARVVTSDYSNPLEVKVSDPTGTITNTVDLLGRTTRYKDALGNETTRTYDVANRALGYAVLGTTVGYTYQPDGLLDTETVNGKVVADSTYAADGRPLSVSYPSGANGLGNGTVGEYSYDALLRPSGVTYRTAGGTAIASESVSRLNSGDLLKQSFDGVVTNGTNPDFAYDGAGRLTGAVVRNSPTAATTTTYGYAFADTAACGVATGAGKNSNRTSKTVGGVVTTYCYDNADRLTSSSAPEVGTIAYDARGNTSSIFGESHTYDIADRHLGTSKAATNVTYTRDATDRIVERKVNGAVVARYGSTGASDSPGIAVDVATNRTQWIFSLPGGATFNYNPGAANSWTYANLEGSVLATADSNGAKVGTTLIWDPDGNNVVGGVPDNLPGSFDYGWHGGEQRPLEQQAGLTSMIEMGARQYSPTVGRFLEVDPVEGGTANDYAYVGDPINQKDLDGKCGTWGNPFKKCGKGHKGGKGFLGGIVTQTGRFIKKHRRGLLQITGVVVGGACVFASGGTATAVCAVAGGAIFTAGAGQQAIDDGALPWDNKPWNWRNTVGCSAVNYSSALPGLAATGKVGKAVTTGFGSAFSNAPKLGGKC